MFLGGCVASQRSVGVPLDTEDTSAEQVVPGARIYGRLYALGQALARARARSAALQTQLDQRTRDLTWLEAEVEEVRQRESKLRAELESITSARAAGTVRQSAETATAAAGPPPAKGKPEAEVGAAAPPPGGRADTAAQEAAVASLRATLAAEQERRQRVESELARLKEETSHPPYGGGAGNEAGLSAARDEVVQLRTALEQERAERKRLAENFHALEERAAQETGRAPDAAATAEMQSRLERLQAEKQTLMDSLNRSLAASEGRVAELEQQLSAVRAEGSEARSKSKGAPGVDLGSIRAENSALRARLDEEHRRTEELTAKLKLVTRVTDLIFKMRAQQVPAPRSRTE